MKISADHLVEIPQSTARPTGANLDIRICKIQIDGFALDVTFTIGPGITILFGASGAGKTTLLDCIAGLTTPDGGQISILDRTLFDSKRGTNLPVRSRKVGYVFQDLALFPHLNVGSNVAYGLSGIDRQERNHRVDRSLDALGILSLRYRLPPQLSGGERQRVALAR